MSFITKEEPGNIFVIDCPQRLDVNISDDLKKIMADLIQRGIYKIVINLTDTRYVDSSGLGAIVSRIAVARSNKGDVRLATTTKSILDLLELTHLNKILQCYDDVLSAVNSYR